ncbi:AbfB domain-containing protein [Streptomyces sp. 2A115]|uniref:AbfB domain-containing protein n=1 Tax=Streptomyces sp. 2A115 TaxID=3457439 RepID=UPI003FD15E14
MSERKPGTELELSTRPQKVWETGEALDETRIPGTRRLWLAGALLLVVLTATVTAVAVLESGTDTSSEDRTENITSAANQPVLPSPPPAAPPTGKSGWASPEPSGTTGDGSTAPEAQQQGGSKPDPSPRPSKPAAPEKPPASTPSSSRKSVQAVNYPDRYWHVADGLVKLDPVRGSESREDSTFAVAKGLSNSSCYSFKTHDGKYLRHRNFILRAERNDGSSLFKQDATFCPGYSGHSGAVMLQSVNYPNYVLRHRNFQLRLDPYGYNTTNREDFSFRLVDPLG